MISEWQPPLELPDLRRVDILAIDTEENEEGLRAGRGAGWAWHGGWVCGISLAWREANEIRKLYIPLRHPNSINFDPVQVYRWLANLITAGVRFVTLNGGFDWGWLRTDGGVLMPPSTQLEEIGALATLIDENQRRYGLDALCQRYDLPGKDMTLLNEAVKAAGFPVRRAKEVLWKMPARYVGPYAEADAVNTLLLFERLNPILDQEGTRNAYRLEVDLMPVTLEMRRRGVRINQDAAEQARDLLLGKRDAALAELSRELGTAVSMHELNRNEWKVKVFDQLGLLYKRTELGNPSFAGGGGKGGWMSAHEHPIPRLISAANKYHNAGHKFIEGYLLNHVVNGRIHAELHPFKTEESGARSFRFSYSDPPLQQMVGRDEELAPLIRGAFEPEEDEIWVDNDADQQEYRLLVHHAELRELPGAKAAGDAYRNNPATDYHQMVVNMTGLDRKPAKAINFGKGYGAGIEKLAQMMGKSVEEARAIVAVYDEKLPFVKALNRVCQRDAERFGYTTLYDGARRHWDLWEMPRMSDKGNGPCDVTEARRRIMDPDHPWFGRQPSRFKTYTAMNAQLQGDGARHTKLWLLAVYRAGIVPLLQLHDSLSCSMTMREQAELVARLGEEAIKLTVPMRVKTEVGRNWGGAKHKWDDLPPARAKSAASPQPASAPVPVPAAAPKRGKTIQAARVELKRLGYDVIPLISGKGTPLKGWPMMPNNEASILTWPGSAAGIRLLGSKLFVIDLDIRVAAVRDTILAMLEHRWPGFMAGCLRRHSGAVTLALIGRTVTSRGHAATARFAGAGTDPRGDLVEVFTGNDKRYIGVAGMHSRGRDYAYLGRSILDVKPDDLPWFPDQDIKTMLAGCETIMAGFGLKVVESAVSKGRATSVFDLEPGMLFTLSDDSTMTLEDLEDLVRSDLEAPEGTHRRLVGYASLWDPTTTTTNRVSVLIGATGLCLHDFKTGITHRWRDNAPPPDALGARLGDLKKAATFAWGTKS
jgi:DNA polymerase I-like protein with 3'-5' exonuclease and polymerase domains